MASTNGASKVRAASKSTKKTADEMTTKKTTTAKATTTKEKPTTSVALADDAMQTLMKRFVLGRYPREFAWACTWSVINKVFDLMPPLMGEFDCK
jgi:hypothetical protein